MWSHLGRLRKKKKRRRRKASEGRDVRFAGCVPAYGATPNFEAGIVRRGTKDASTRLKSAMTATVATKKVFISVRLDPSSWKWKLQRILVRKIDRTPRIMRRQTGAVDAFFFCCAQLFRLWSRLTLPEHQCPARSSFRTSKSLHISLSSPNSVSGALEQRCTSLFHHFASSDAFRLHITISLQKDDMNITKIGSKFRFVPQMVSPLFLSSKKDPALKNHPGKKMSWRARLSTNLRELRFLFSESAKHSEGTRYVN
jgi:hypothetical protein